MKKNKMMRLASVLLVAVLMTTSVISGTFAKYVTSDNATDTARVAKWGVTVLASGNLFGTKYADKNAGATANSIVAESTNVASSDTTKVVAPGTKNEAGFTVAISGVPEVAYDVKATNNGIVAEDIFLNSGTYGVMVEATGLNAATNVAGYYTFDSINNKYIPATGVYVAGTTYYELHDTVVLANKYYPLVWTVTETGSAADITKTQDLASIAAELIANFDAMAGTANNVNAPASYNLAWNWDFDDSGTGTNDGADTILGNIGHGLNVVKLTATPNEYTSVLEDGVDYNLEVKLGIAVTVTQVD